MQALHDVPVQTRGIRHQLDAGEHLRALERHTPRHDEADVAGAENDDALSGHVALDVHVALRRTGCENAGAACAGDGDRAACALPAAHRQHDGLRGDLLIAVCGVDAADVLFRRHIQHHRVGQDTDGGAAEHTDEPSRVFRAGQLLLEVVQAEAVVDALVQNAAQLTVALKDQNVVQTRVIGRACGGKTGGTAADDGKLTGFHLCAPPFVSPVRMYVPG